VLPLAILLPGLVIPAVITGAAVTVIYAGLGRHTGISAWNAVLAPMAAVLMIYALFRSMMTTLRQGGVVWRGTFYPLAELKKHIAPMP
jgi:hypothetical protein